MGQTAPSLHRALGLLLTVSVLVLPAALFGVPRPALAEAIVVTEIPYQVNKARMIERMADMVREKRIEGISDIRDESDRHGMRIVLELRRDTYAQLVLNNLFRHTAMRTSFNANVLALVDGQPQVLPLKRCLEHFITHRQEVIRRRSANCFTSSGIAE